MKQPILIIISLIYINEVNAQFDENHSIYTTSELNLGNYIGANINLNYVYQETYSL